MSLPPLLASILGWLRAGYPNGVPEQDYVPLMALLRRQLSDDEIAVLADDLVAEFPVPVDPIDIGVLITKVTDDIPHEADVARVREHLIRGGWKIEAQPPVDDA
ncbi:DUF3349 domain-containing protein [Rhodococcus erythropolis]|uniref:DUF3349 domain-containing protein n=1 Tax=Rhodococcus baikonurensis TaxID=172041 RepID=A0ABV5X982_9NOCA|nr:MULTISPECIES: DUF3349 domain-containing protein [Rhodococcus]NHP14751.1 DUF3349 domain-containing protein [Rhodococcus sp. IC4_135]MBJ7480752.1 DUF3349 domain-containing protein [Rhodococcus sp. (in: high G+C Gram-positive bacteria)]PBI99177.1 hypothetical protein BKP42_18400 [Rhodococcus erythropolis]QQM20310.1 DUF3349 domain-containing protein [Rhodococcus sp. P-2]RQO43666.1 DUF3349 domain-containing protein [Rhodococcus sp. KBW08]